MDRELMKKMLGAVIQHMDYDLWKNKYNEETLEYGEDLDTNFDEILDVAEDVFDQEQ